MSNLLGMLATDPDLPARHRGQDLIADMQYYGRDFEHALAGEGIRLLRKARKGEPPRAGAHLAKPLRQTGRRKSPTRPGEPSSSTH